MRQRVIAALSTMAAQEEILNHGRDGGASNRFGGKAILITDRISHNDCRRGTARTA
jgi:hypothetical protein